MHKISKIAYQGICDDDDRELLGNSLYYYCCGCDPTPIIAFDSQYPLYVYVDIVQYGNGDFTKETKKLYKRLKEFGFQEKYKEHNGKYFASADNDINKNNIQLIIEQSELSQWITKHGSSFYLLYIQGDAVTVFWKMYHESRNNNYIQPKCICNFRYEFMDGTKNLNHIEKRARYIMGYAHGEKYKKVGEYKYYGDFGEGTVPLYKRICYYVY